MKREKIKIKNFRSLKNFSIDLEDELSLIVGKNNVGKTSVIEILNKFLNKNTTLFSDVISHYTHGKFASSLILYTSRSGSTPGGKNIIHWECETVQVNNSQSCGAHVRF